MKKFILVMVFILLVALFIAFNYLLWDRESKVADIKNLESLNASYNSNISAQRREIDTLENEVGGLLDKIEQFETDISRIQKERDAAITERDKTEDSLRDRINVINVLKENTDIQFLSQSVIKWAEALTQGNFEEAYEIEYAGIPEENRVVSLSSYIEQMHSTISKVEITDIKVDRLRGSGSGDIYLDARIDVTLIENAISTDSRFAAGENEIFIRLTYSKDQQAFLISAINTV